MRATRANASLLDMLHLEFTRTGKRSTKKLAGDKARLELTMTTEDAGKLRAFAEDRDVSVSELIRAFVRLLEHEQQ